MKKTTTKMFLGILLGTILAASTVSAALGVLAERSAQAVYVDGQRVELEAYLIDGANYVKLRDVGQATNAINVYWDGSAVQIQSGVPYTGEGPSGAVAQPEPSVEAPSVTDYSATANPEIFSGIYAREAYNAAYEVLGATCAGDYSKTAAVHYADYSDRQKFENLLGDLSNGTTLSMRASGNDVYEIYAIKVDRTPADTATSELLREARQLRTDMLREVGVLPIILPTRATPEELSKLNSICDGYLFTGGHDVDPALYGAEKSPWCGTVNSERDTLDLYQDLNTERPSFVDHHMAPPYNRHIHRATLQPRGILSDVLRVHTIGVNSYHHQTIQTPAECLRVAAVSEDGLIEGVSYPGKRFVLVVQWHPEFSYHDDADSRAIVRAFAAAVASV